MNRHVLRAEVATSEALKPSTWEENAAAFLSLALTQRRLFHEKRREATEAMLRGRVDEHRRLEASARRLWYAALGHLSYARHHRDMGVNRGA